MFIMFVGRYGGPEIPNSRGSVRSVITSQWHLIASAKGLELFDFRNDPGEQQNLAGSSNAQQAIAMLEKDLPPPQDRSLKSAEKEAQLPHDAERQLRTLGYAN